MICKQKSYNLDSIFYVRVGKVVYCLMGRDRQKYISMKINSVERCMRIAEMAYDRNYIIEKCYGYGKQFIEHFDKLWNDKADDINHHLSEMQAWYDKARTYKLKSNNKTINTRQMFDWFFMPNAVVATDLFDDEEEAESYITFVHTMQDEDLNAKEAWNMISNEITKG